MSELNIDELNVVQGKSIPLYDYFYGMDLTKIEKEYRLKFAQDLLDDIIAYFTELSVFKIDATTIKYAKLLEKAVTRANMSLDDYLRDYIDTMSDILNNPDEENNLDRAIFIAENETNNILNYKEFKEALGKYKYKRWNAFTDGKTRMSHRELNGVVIPIREYFSVGKDSEMLFPGDLSRNPNPKEYIRCRCTAMYFNI